MDECVEGNVFGYTHTLTCLMSVQVLLLFLLFTHICWCIDIYVLTEYSIRESTAKLINQNFARTNVRKLIKNGFESETCFWRIKLVKKCVCANDVVIRVPIRIQTCLTIFNICSHRDKCLVMVTGQLSMGAHGIDDDLSQN